MKECDYIIVINIEKRTEHTDTSTNEETFTNDGKDRSKIDEERRKQKEREREKVISYLFVIKNNLLYALCFSSSLFDCFAS